ncbi:MAG: PAS domain-containing protein, partial [Anaerolineales bacterium]|nr:PAS domain-containing protein [Anaerolineales bacterium]
MRPTSSWRMSLGSILFKKVKWQTYLSEAGLFLLVYLLWLFVSVPEWPVRPYVGALGIVVPLITAAFLTLAIRAEMPVSFHRGYLVLSLSFVFWALGHFFRLYEWLLMSQPILPPLAFSLADILNAVAYPFFFVALLLYPEKHRFFPSRFRFTLDAVLSAGVVAVLAWMTIARPALETVGSALRTVVPFVYPLADLVLLMVLFSASLAKSILGRSIFSFGLGLVAFFISDYVYAYQAMIQAYRPGGFESLGWIVGGLAFGLAVAFQAEAPVSFANASDSPEVLAEPAARLQNILPFVLMIALIWFLFMDWQWRGSPFFPGLLMALVLGLGLIVRLGVRAGELELYKYWQLFSALAEPVFLCDREGRLLLANPALRRAVGLNEEEIVSRLLTDFFCGDSVTSDLLSRAAIRPILVEARFCSSGLPC